ncbi:MAG: BON domain-containing protein, partial [Acidobacteria bacterium]|nr:BON domain-containing protein [Acidobacteriota bacterium]
MIARILGASFLLLAVFAVPAWAQDERKGDEIFKDVSNAVLTYPQFTIFDDVSAAVEGGVITLQGRVTMPFKRNDIEKRVGKIAGITRVNNRIGVLPVSGFDDDLRYAVARAIYGSSAFWQYASMSNPPIHIIVERGRVTLTGVVASEVDRMLARSLASTFGAFSVTSELKTDAEVQTLVDRR